MIRRLCRWTLYALAFVALDVALCWVWVQLNFWLWPEGL